jgi:hypothetical protein
VYFLGSSIDTLSLPLDDELLELKLTASDDGLFCGIDEEDKEAEDDEEEEDVINSIEHEPEPPERMRTQRSGSPSGPG